MYIKKSIMDTEGFTLDVASIGNTSTSKTRLRLPYYGPLSAGLDGATSVSIAITLQVGLIVSLFLIVEWEGKLRRYPISATAEEIDHILHLFFFTKDGHTRCDTGLDRYSLGFNQSSYINWRRLVLDTYGVESILSQLSPTSLERALQCIRHNKTA